MPVALFPFRPTIFVIIKSNRNVCASLLGYRLPIRTFTNGCGTGRPLRLFTPKLGLPYGKQAESCGPSLLN